MEVQSKLSRRGESTTTLLAETKISQTNLPAYPIPSVLFSPYYSVYSVRYYKSNNRAGAIGLLAEILSLFFREITSNMRASSRTIIIRHRATTGDQKLFAVPVQRALVVILPFGQCEL